MGRLGGARGDDETLDKPTREPDERDGPRQQREVDEGSRARLEERSPQPVLTLATELHWSQEARWVCCGVLPVRALLSMSQEAYLGNNILDSVWFG